MNSLITKNVCVVAGLLYSAASVHAQENVGDQKERTQTIAVSKPADEGNKAVIVLSLPLISMASTKQDANGTKEYVTDTHTKNYNNASLAIFAGRYVFYALPSGFKRIKVGYKITPEVEIGVTTGLNTIKVDKPKSESNSQLFGADVTYTMARGQDDIDLQVGARTSSDTSEAVDAATGLVSKTNVAGSKAWVEAAYIIPVTNNLKYMTAIGYEMETETNKQATPRKVIKTNSLYVDLLKFRAVF